MALDNIATPTSVDEIPFKGRSFWVLTGNDTDASTAIEIKAAPGVGKALYITYAALSSDADAVNPQLQDEDGNVLYGLFYTSTRTSVFEHQFTRPLKLVSNKALELKAAGSGVISVYVEGAIAEG